MGAKKKWNYFPLPPWKGYGFEIYEARRGKCHAKWATYQWTLLWRIFNKPYILSIYLFLCEYGFFTCTLLYIAAPSLLPTTGFSICFYNIYMCVCVCVYTYTIKTVWTHTHSTHIYVFLNYMHVLLHCYIFYIPSYNQKKKIKRMWQNKYTLKFYISFLPSSGSACELPGECLPHVGDH